MARFKYAFVFAVLLVYYTSQYILSHSSTVIHCDDAELKNVRHDEDVCRGTIMFAILLYN